jgi:hypothetical protein
MVIRDAANRVEATKIIFVRVVSSMPRNNIERVMILSGHKELAVEFGDVPPFCYRVMVICCDGRLEIPRVCKRLRSNGSQLRQLEVPLV